ncbi:MULTISPECIES: PASTA domain-containing protein [Lactobacillales]|uniref:PASTA domain-containing protein n=2 Tax=Lacticaseibacillus TaxID=2759736 RepID=H6V6D4_LACCA|nr:MULTISPECIES: PASTA domain-containing protein [Lactobacillales]AFA42417.1 hypothetical protein [Lacticaseibacillus casei]
MMVNSKSKKKTLTALSNKGLGVFGEVLNTLHSVADTVNKVTPKIVDEGVKVIDSHLEKHKDDFKMPGLSQISVAEAKRILALYPINFSLVLVTPDIKLAQQRPNVIIKTSPKENTKVTPGSFIRVFYADDNVIAISRQLADDQASKKQGMRSRTRVDNQDRIIPVMKGIKLVSSGVNTFAGKLTFNKKIKNSLSKEPLDPSDPVITQETKKTRPSS